MDSGLNLQEVISVVLPVKNHRRFIEERVKTICEQTYTNWKCYVVDGYSDDGTWEWLLQHVGADERFNLMQREPQGIYDAWNFGIEQCKGNYIYIATSDDTMKSVCFEKFVQLMEQYPDCGLAHSLLEIIDEDGNKVEPNPWLTYLPQKYYAEKLFQLHVRKAPVDGILHAYLFSMYTSVTQLLIRRSLFERIGLFATSFGAKADFEWCMRAALTTNVLHIPQYLATWRMHNEQLTATTAFDFHKDYLHNAAMVQSAIHKTKQLGSVQAVNKLNNLDLFYRSRFIEGGFVKIQSRFKRLIYLFKYSVIDFPAVFFYLKLRNKSTLEIAKQSVRELI